MVSALSLLCRQPRDRIKRGAGSPYRPRWTCSRHFLTSKFPIPQTSDLRPQFLCTSARTVDRCCPQSASIIDSLPYLPFYLPTVLHLQYSEPAGFATFRPTPVDRVLQTPRSRNNHLSSSPRPLVPYHHGLTLFLAVSVVAASRYR